MLFSEPENGDYRKREAYAITGSVPLPTPFGFPLEDLA